MSKIKKVEIQNFKGVKFWESSITGPKLITGCNGAGKTSYLEALRFVLTGKMPQDMLRHDCESGYVKVFFSDPNETTVTRSFYAGDKPNKVKVNGKTTTAKEAQKIICDILGVAEDKLQLLTSDTLFRELISGDVGSFLTEFINEPMDYAKLYTLCSFTAEEKIKIETSLLPERFSVSDIDGVYQTLFTQRAGIKKVRASVQAKMEDEPLPEPFYKTEEEVKAGEELYISKAADEKSFADRKAKYTRELAEYQARRDRKAALEARFKTAEFFTEATEENITSVEKTQQELTTQKHNFETIIASSDVVVKSQQKILDALDSPKCPISDCLVCKTDKTEARAEVLAGLKAAQESIDAAKKAIETLDCQIAENSEKLLELKREVKANQEYLELEKRISDINIGTPPEPVEEVSDGDEDWKNHPRRKAEYEDWLKDKAVREEYDELSKELDIVCSLLEKFAPKGVVNSAIISRYCDIFNEQAASLADMFSYKVNFVPDNGIRLKIKPETSDKEVDFTSLSSGEQTIVTLIIYTVLNVLMGTDIIFMDNLNDLDPENYKKFLEVLDVVENEFGIETIFVATCSEE